MAYNEDLANRVRVYLLETNQPIEEKKMFGGLCFMVHAKMCIGVERDKLMLWLDPKEYDQYLDKEGALPMDFTGRPLKGFIYVEAWAVEKRKALELWLDKALQYNKMIKPAKRKK